MVCSDNGRIPLSLVTLVVCCSLAWLVHGLPQLPPLDKGCTTCRSAKRMVDRERRLYRDAKYIFPCHQLQGLDGRSSSVGGSHLSIFVTFGYWRLGMLPPPPVLPCTYLLVAVVPCCPLSPGCLSPTVGLVWWSGRPQKRGCCAALPRWQPYTCTTSM